jgi:hypothetical protein
MANTGITTSLQFPVINPASRSLLVDPDAPRGVSIKQTRPDVPGLNRFEVRCLLIQLGQLESNTNANLIGVGVPQIGIYKASISSNTSFANVASITITNNDHSEIKVGMFANIAGTSTGAFGSNTIVIEKSLGGDTQAGKFVPGFTYTITSIGTTDFTLCGVPFVANVAVGLEFIANAVGSGTGTALIGNNQIKLASNHTISGAISFTVSPLLLGKYQNSQWLLYNKGFLDINNQWTGKDGIDSNDLFLAATLIQENVMTEFLTEKYNELIKSNAIRSGDTKDKVAGMLALAYQYQDLGNPQLKQSVYNSDGTINSETFSIASKANVWRETGQTVDSRGRPGHIYFNNGRYAIMTLGADTPE